MKHNGINALSLNTSNKQRHRGRYRLPAVPPIRSAARLLVSTRTPCRVCFSSGTIGERNSA